jgi:hypothetical protein
VADSPNSAALTPETAELVGALTGDKGVFKKTRRYRYDEGNDCKARYATNDLIA